MKQLKRIISLCLVVALLAVYTPAIAQAEETMTIASGSCGYNLTWRLTEDGTLTISGTGAMTNYYTGSAPWYSSRSSVKTVVIEGGVTSVGDCAFQHCTSLTDVTISDSVVSIGFSAFNGCSNLTHVTIPDSVTSIDSYAFGDCSSLADISISNGVTSIDRGVFGGCSSLIGISIPDGVTSIGEYAFDGCSSLTHVTIPDGATSIGNFAFYECTSLTSISIPDSVTSIGDRTFRFCDSLTYNEYGNAQYLGNDLNPYVFLMKTSSTDITSVDIHDATKVIYDDAFKNCNNLTSVTIPDSVTSVSAEAFSCCTALTNVTIGDGVTSISDYAFYSCNSLTSVTIPNSVTSISDYAFYSCNSLTSVTIPNSVTSIGMYAFYNSGLTSVVIPGSVVVIGERAFNGCDNLTSVIMQEGVTSIGDSAFANGEIAYIEVPSSVTSIGDFAFQDTTESTFSPNCTMTIKFCGDAPTEKNEIFGSINTGVAYYPAGNSTWTEEVMQSYVGEGEITWVPYSTDADIVASGACGDATTWEYSLDGTLTISGEGAMYDGYHWTSVPWYLYCGGITDIIIDSGVETISDNAFYNCVNLTDIMIPESVVSIGDSAFYYCWRLTEVSVPASVSYIAENAFADCRKLFGFWVDKDNQYYSNDSIGVLLDKNKTTIVRAPGLIGNTYTVPDGVTSIGSYAFYNCNNLISITLPSGVNSIGDEAFHYCGGLIHITLPDGMQSIGEDAFNYCTSLISITIPSSVTRIENYAFRNCPNLQIKFDGDGPELGEYTFYRTAITIQYPAMNETWTEMVLQNYGGYITWIPYYEILEGANSVVKTGKGETISIRVNGEYSNFESVSVDENTVNPVNYIVTEGSTIVTFHADYLDALVYGEHTVSVHFSNGIATTTMTILASVGDVDGDAEISDWDAIILNRYLAGWDVTITQTAADVDGDGEVSDWDAIVLERYLAGWDITIG